MLARACLGIEPFAGELSPLPMAARYIATMLELAVFFEVVYSWLLLSHSCLRWRLWFENIVTAGWRFTVFWTGEFLAGLEVHEFVMEQLTSGKKLRTWRMQYLT